MQRRGFSIGLVCAWIFLGAIFPIAGSFGGLTPSRTSLAAQVRQARAHDFTYLRDANHVRHFVDRGWLVPLGGDRNYRLSGVSFPYARPETALFVERLSRQYRSACGERLVVTSATRPESHQPGNASPDSVHPTGMALDLRRSARRSCRQWLERTLVTLEKRGVLEASLERWPPHYHLAVFPEDYRRYVERLNRGTHQVRHGETLWAIARRYSTTVGRLRNLNGLRGDVIRPGQVLSVPTGG